MKTLIALILYLSTFYASNPESFNFSIAKFNKQWEEEMTELYINSTREICELNDQYLAASIVAKNKSSSIVDRYAALTEKLEAERKFEAYQLQISSQFSASLAN